MEKLWGSYYYYMGNDLFATGLLFFTLHEAMYFGRCIPWMIIDRIPYFNKYKIQDAKIPSNKEQWECLKSVLTSHFLVEAFPIWFFHPLCQQIGISFEIPFPDISSMLIQLAVFSYVRTHGITGSIEPYTTVSSTSISISNITDTRHHSD